MFWGWLRGLWPRRDEQARGAGKDEVRRRLELAMARARAETSALESDGLALAERIKRNTERGRSIGGTKPL